MKRPVCCEVSEAGHLSRSEPSPLASYAAKALRKVSAVSCQPNPASSLSTASPMQYLLAVTDGNWLPRGPRPNLQGLGGGLAPRRAAHGAHWHVMWTCPGAHEPAPSYGSNSKAGGAHAVPPRADGWELDTLQVRSQAEPAGTWRRSGPQTCGTRAHWHVEMPWCPRTSPQLWVK